MCSKCFFTSILDCARTVGISDTFYSTNEFNKQTFVKVSVTGNISREKFSGVKENLKHQYISRCLAVTILGDRNAEKLQKITFRHLLIEIKSSHMWNSG